MAGLFLVIVCSMSLARRLQTHDGWSTIRWNIRYGHLRSVTVPYLDHNLCNCRPLILTFTRPKSEAQSGGYNSANSLQYMSYGVNVLMIYFTNARKYLKLISVSTFELSVPAFTSWQTVVMWCYSFTAKEISSLKGTVNVYLTHF